MSSKEMLKEIALMCGRYDILPTYSRELEGLYAALAARYVRMVLNIPIYQEGTNSSFISCLDMRFRPEKIGTFDDVLKVVEQTIAEKYGSTDSVRWRSFKDYVRVWINDGRLVGDMEDCITLILLTEKMKQYGDDRTAQMTVLDRLKTNSTVTIGSYTFTPLKNGKHRVKGDLGKLQNTLDKINGKEGQ